MSVTSSPTIRQLLREVVPQEDAGPIVLSAPSAGQASLLHGAFDVRDLTFENRVDAFQSDEGVGPIRRTIALPMMAGPRRPRPECAAGSRPRTRSPAAAGLPDI